MHQSDGVCYYLQSLQLRSLPHRKLVPQFNFRIHEAASQDESYCCFMTRFGMSVLAGFDNAPLFSQDQ
jgi:hypothetical protein